MTGPRIRRHGPDADLFVAMVGAIVVLDLLRRFLRWLARLRLVHRPRRVGEL